METAPKRKLEPLLRIISLCETVELKGINPFEVEVKEALDYIRRYLPRWKSFEEFCLDAEAVNNLSKVIKLQGDWIKHRSSLLYVDPIVVESKIKKASLEGVANVFLKAWHPIVQMERLSSRRLREAMRYWNLLPSQRGGAGGLSTQLLDVLGFVSRDELIRLKLIVEGDFNQTLVNLWEELVGRVGKEGKVSYWDFIYADTFEGLVTRAYLTSFLLTYGYADVEIDPLKEEILLLPRSKPEVSHKQEQRSSVPIPIDYVRWKMLKEQR